MKKQATLLLYVILLFSGIEAKEYYFVDGYHGGIYGHYPVSWKTGFIVEQLNRHPEWRVCLEIEPETWDTVAVRTPESYERLKSEAKGERIEFINPTYSQPYMYNVIGESIIRQFQYGMKKIQKHFPGVEFVTYSCEEPCFTSCLPQLLKQLGYKYASTKNPNTCWGGYVTGYGRELVNWIGSDGSRILTSPRYECEGFVEGSTWQTASWNNNKGYLRACDSAKIGHPVGMTIQDAGWKNGPWLGRKGKGSESRYVTWREYFEKYAEKATEDNWYLSQEDIRPNLMWGSQVMQRIGQEVRTSEYKITKAEKISVISNMQTRYRYDRSRVDEAWRTLMLAQHHDSWIVPYNGLHQYGTWADAINMWTRTTDSIAECVIGEAMEAFSGGDGREGTNYLRVYNTMGKARKEVLTKEVPECWKGEEIELSDEYGREIETSIIREKGNDYLQFIAEVPAFGYTTYKISRGKGKSRIGKKEDVKGMECDIENDLYKLTFDLTQGGVIKRFLVKANNRDLVKADKTYMMNEMRGYFYKEGRYRTSRESPVKATVINKNSLQTRIKLEGEIAGHPYEEIVTIEQGSPRIDFELQIKWKHNEGIGEYEEKDWVKNRRGYVNDRYKLNVLFPVAIEGAKLYKDAPFDVCESKLANTYYNTWDSIKNNVILQWIDLEGQDKSSFALLTNHTTSYTYGEDYPMGLTLQYSGQGLWGRDYKIDRPTRVKFSVVYHEGKWDESGLTNENEKWNEPLESRYYDRVAMEKYSFIDLGKSDCQISAMYFDEKGLVMRLYNTGDKMGDITIDTRVSRVIQEDLKGTEEGIIPIYKTLAGRNVIRPKIPKYGVRTYRIEITEK